VKVTKDLCVVMDQKEAKGYTPPGTGSCLWRSTADSAWHCRIRWLPEHSRTVRKPNALHWVLCRAWEDWALLEGVALAALPIDGWEADDGL
jgi:hypothetical protein